MAATHTTTPTRGRGLGGLVTFAGIMLIIAGAFNLLDGIVALVNDSYFRVDELLFGDLSAWGVWWLIVGAAQLGTGFAVLAGKSWGMLTGIGLAAINAFTALMFLGVAPGWAIAVMVVDGLIIYGLVSGFVESTD
jgi:hypothetical protein